MRKNITWAILMAATALIQTTWLDAVQVKGVTPNLVLLVVIYFAIIDGEERAMFSGVLGGLFQDVARDSVLGHHVLCYVAVGFLTARVAVRLITQHPAVKVGLVCIAGIFFGLCYSVIQAVQDPQWAVFASLKQTVIPSTLYTALLTPFVFFAMDRLFRRHYSPQS